MAGMLSAVRHHPAHAGRNIPEASLRRRSTRSVALAWISRTTLTGPHDGQLHGVPDAQEEREVQPSRHASLDEIPEDGCGEEIRDGEEHRGDSPFEAASGADGVEEPVGGHVASQEVAGVDAEGPDESEHGGVLSWSRRQEPEGLTRERWSHTVATSDSAF